MRFYVSQLVETEKILPILRRYDVGLEVVHFANPYVLDNRYEMMDVYKKELEDLYNNVDLIIHGPYADLSPGSRDSEIRRVSKFRMEQAFEVANNLGASKIVYHNGYIPKSYSYIEWNENVYNYWRDFLKGKDDMNILVENVLEEDYVLMDELMKRIENTNFSTCIDIGHINTYSKVDIEKWIDVLLPKLSHIHLHNNYKDKDSHSGINKGNINIIEVLNKLKKKKKDLTISLEIVDINDLQESLDILVEEGFIKLK